MTDVNILRYWHTVRHLKARQVSGRVLRHLKRLDVQVPGAVTWLTPRAPMKSADWRSPAWLGDGRFRFLNEERQMPGSGGWNDPHASKLWLYNLHYFDWLHAGPEPGRPIIDDALAQHWMRRWIAENPAALGNGWEPYAISLRWVNWAKWLCRPAAGGLAPDPDIVASMALQAHLLAQQLETHLLGNHLLENAKTLLFAGSLFEGKVAQAWWETGARLMDAELDEQILGDGAYFELSPMYHAIVLEGLVDLASLQQICPDRPWDAMNLGAQRLERLMSNMRRWLAVTTHPDGDIAFFNDSAIGNAPALSVIDQLRSPKVGAPGVSPSEEAQGLQVMQESGFVRARRGDMVLIARLGGMGPDYLPGHAHADSLSFEMSLGNQRVFVNSGTSVYGSGPERQRQRGTAAHNTVCVDGRDSSEVWGGFRVARRARPEKMAIVQGDSVWSIAGGHDGYRVLPGRVIHRREWRVGAAGITVIDRLQGGFDKASARFHLHPDVVCSGFGPTGGLLRLPDGRVVTFRVVSGRARLEDSSYHPMFGASIGNICLVVDFLTGACVVEVEY